MARPPDCPSGIATAIRRRPSPYLTSRDQDQRIVFLPAVVMGEIAGRTAKIRYHILHRLDKKTLHLRPANACHLTQMIDIMSSQQNASPSHLSSYSRIKVLSKTAGKRAKMLMPGRADN